jgi:hypothetical protein
LSCWFFLRAKAAFIKSKYDLLSFAFKLHPDTSSPSVDELSRQLHANVSTDNLETSMRLLHLGADPDYYHPVRRF